MGVEDLLVCSVCRGSLTASATDNGAAVCAECQRIYDRREAVYDMTPLPVPDADVQEQWPLWEQLQDNGAVAYEVDPEANLSFGRRRDADFFAEFSDLQGLTLDVGCGPQLVPSYGVDFDGRLVGIDPLQGVQPRKFEFVQGIGEYLPFRSGTFDRVLFATSLDHTLVPLRALREARRVVKHDGLVSIWFAEHDHGRADGARSWRRRARTATSLLRKRDFAGVVERSRAVFRLTAALAPSYLADLSIPAGAEDHFHAFHLDRPLVDRWIADAGLTTVNSHVDQTAGCVVVAKPTS